MKKLVLSLAGLALCGIAMIMTFKWGYNVGYYEAKDDVTLVCELSEDVNAAYVPTDEESMERRIREDLGSNYYGELISNEKPGVVEFIVYDSKGNERYFGTYERFSSYCTYIPTGNSLNDL